MLGISKLRYSFALWLTLRSAGFAPLTCVRLTAMQWVALASLAVLVLGLIVPFLLWRNARKATALAAGAQEYDYAIRLQVRDEQNIDHGSVGPDVFTY